jgi:hypothetical protein
MQQNPAVLTPGRDPAAFVEMIQQVILGLVLALSLRQDLSNAWSAAVLAVGGLIVAAWVVKEKLLVALVAAIRAVFALVVTLGLDLNPTVETGLIMAASAAVTFWLRGKVTAPIDENGNKVFVVNGSVTSVREQR